MSDQQKPKCLYYNDNGKCKQKECNNHNRDENGYCMCHGVDFIGTRIRKSQRRFNDFICSRG